MMRVCVGIAVFVCGCWVPTISGASVATLVATSSASVTAFESGQVRPLAISPDGTTLFVTNTPNNRLEIYAISPKRLEKIGSVPVGLEPVAVAARNNREVWVVNHLSDSISVVAIEPGHARVVRTLLTADEPRDIVFAGPGRNRAFVTTAHRGQNAPYDPQLSTPGIGRADVWVFDATRTDSTFGGTPLTIISLFADTPRALTVSPDGSRVYAAAFHSGNKTTSVNGLRIPAGTLPPPLTNFEGTPDPQGFPNALIVKHDGTHWRDELGRDWDSSINFNLPDKDVFVIDAMQSPPRQLTGTAGFYTGVGTVIFNLAANPVNGRIYASNTEAFNHVRFEGAGNFAGKPTVRGHLHESRITVLSSGRVLPRHLNKHIDYTQCCSALPNAENAKSLAFPTSMAVSNDGATLYVAALGSAKVGIFKTAELESDSFVPNAQASIGVSGGGPTGLALSADGSQLFVLTRFDNGLSVVDVRSRREIWHARMFNPEPQSIVKGRSFLYDARMSAHGDSACASCHVFGDFDSLAWDLGNPDASTISNTNPFVNPPTTPPVFNALKGPMTTQSLRGMANHGPMHWRGDRTGSLTQPNAQPDSGAFDEQAAFKAFNVAFVDLIGRSAPIPAADMQAFTDFILQVTYPPNPIRNLDDSLTPNQQAGRDFYFGPISIVGFPLNCNGCHVLDPSGNPGSAAPGFFGSDGRQAFTFQNQEFKNSHLRNAYQKVGMFGFPPAEPFFPSIDTEHTGDQVRGFGFSHDGSFDTMFRFLLNPAFTPSAVLFPGPGPIDLDANGLQIRRNLEAFMFAFDTNLKPIVGQQVTLHVANLSAAAARADLLVARAEAGDCDLVVKTDVLGWELGFYYTGSGNFAPDRTLLPAVSYSQLRALARVAEITLSAVPRGSGRRIGIDRDGDGSLDGDELDRGTDPENSQSHL